MSVSHSKCPMCGAELKYTPEQDAWQCEFCGEIFHEEDLKDAASEEAASKQTFVDADEDEVATDETEGIKMVKYKCSYCGAEVITAEDTSATFCVYCHRPLTLIEQLSGSFRPDKVLPFKKTKDDAMTAFKEYTKNKPLLPDNFFDDLNIQKVMGVYLPFYVYDYGISVHASGNASKVSSVRSGDYQITTTRNYRVERGGTMEFENIPVDASTKIPDDIMDSIEPFDFVDMKDFNSNYLSGFLAQRYDQTKDEVEERAKTRAKGTSKEMLQSTMGMYNGAKNLNIDDYQETSAASRYVLLPVWLLYTEYNGEFYIFAMNGQSGKFIGNLPIDKKKLNKFRLMFYLGFNVVGGLGMFLLKLFAM